jgi:putative oxidoreductase
MLKRLMAVRPFSVDLGLLIFRVATAGLLLLHGWPKLRDFSRWSGDFSNPIGIGSTPSLVLVIFAEVFCTILVIAGLFTRLALVPIMINLAVIILIVHGDDTIRQNELPILFLLGSLGVFMTGPGKYSLDNMIR